MICRHVVAGVLLLLSVATPRLGAQSLTRGDSLLAAGDSLGAISAYRTAYEHQPDLAEAYFREGMIRFAWARSLPTGTVSQRRVVRGEERAAEDRFRTAARLAPDTVRYWLALSDLLRARGGMLARVEAKAFVDSAVRAGTRAGGAQLADAHYRAGRIAFHQFEQYARRFQFVGSAIAVDQPVLMESWDHVERFLTHQVREETSDFGEIYQRDAENHLRAALSMDPGHVAAAGLLSVLLGEQHRWAEAYELARGLTRAAPERGDAWAVLGMTLVRQGRWTEGQRAYERALARMEHRERAPYTQLGLLLRKADSYTYDRLAEPQRAAFERIFWEANRPLFLGRVNEVQLEFQARLTYVIHRWSDPWRGHAGYETHRGLVYVRYGPPDVWANLGRGRANTEGPKPEPIRVVLDLGTRFAVVDIDVPAPDDPVGGLDHERIMILWAYRASQLRFLFSLTPGLERARFAGDMEAFYDEARGLLPARFDNVPAVTRMDTIPVQVAQFRGPTPDSTDVAVFSFIPTERMRADTDLREMPLETGAIVKDVGMEDVVRDRRTETLRHGSPAIARRSWRLSLRPDEYLLRVEARLPVAQRAARTNEALAVRRFGADSLQLSDILMADRAQPRDSAPGRWTDFLIEPNAARFRPEDPVTLLWEVYNLTPDSSGTARYLVTLAVTVRDIERPTEAARVIGGVLDAIGLTARGDDQVVLEYGREVTVTSRGVVVEHLVIDLESDRSATYEVTLSVHDLQSNSTATVQRAFTVSERPPGS